MFRLRVIRRQRDRRPPRLLAREAARMLGCSIRQVFRLKAKVRDRGDAGIVQGNRGRKARNAKPAATRRQVLALTPEYPWVPDFR